MLRKGGRCAVVGIPIVPVEVETKPPVLWELELVGSRASAGEMRGVIPFDEQGTMRARDVMAHELMLEQFGETSATLRDKSSGAIKIIVQP